jgi:SAM-dependent methyltransferase
MQEAETTLEREVRRLYKVPEGTAVEELTEPKRTYVNYALQTVLRGRLAMEEIRPYRAIEGIRFLDAGCAYGGFLAAAAEAGAKEVVGIDVDDRFLDIARPFLSAYGIPHQVAKGDASDPAFMKPLGGFDLITCNDVIEHVDSIPRLVESLAGAVNEGGCVYIAAPNRMCPEFIRKDPHFQYFGIVLLPRDSAREYYFSTTAWREYDVGDYLELEDHRALIESHGLELDVINVPEGSPRQRVQDLEAQFREIEESGASFNDPRLTEDKNREVRDAVTAAVAGFRKRVARLRELEAAGDEAAAEREATAIVRDHAVAVWHLVARRPSKEGYRTEQPSLAKRLRGAVGRFLRG